MVDEIQVDLTMRAELDLFWDLFVPEGIATPAPLLIAVHGYGAHKRYMMREAKLVAGDKFVIASIQAPHPHYRPTPDGGYRIGYAVSDDLMNWKRNDELAGLGVSADGWDSEMANYGHLFSLDGETYMIYQGNEMGRTGIGLARLQHCPDWFRP